MPHMATMTAAKVCNPIALLIPVKTSYSLVHVFRVSIHLQASSNG